MEFTNYWLPLIWIMTAGVFVDLVFSKRREYVLGDVKVRWRVVSALLVAFPYILFATFRNFYIFGDTGMYRRMYMEVPTSFPKLWPYIQELSKDKGFGVFQIFIKIVFGTNVRYLFFFVALIQMLCLALTYRKFSCDFWLSIFLFVASADYYSWMHNGMRQFLAAAIIFAGFPLLVRKKYVPMILLVFLAATQHAISLIFLPFIFIAQGKAWNKRTLFFILAIAASVVFLERFTGLVTSTMEDTAYEGEIVQFVEDDGTNIMRVLFYAVPTAAAFIFRKRIDKFNNPLINVCINLSIASTGFYVLSFFTSGILMGRVPIYFSLSNYILLPWLIHKLFTKKSATFLKVILCFVYFAFFYYQMGITWGML